MNTVRHASRLSAILAVGAPAAGCALTGLWVLSLAFLAIGALWLLGRWWRWPVSGLGFAAGTTGLVFASLLEVGPGWLLPGVVGMLAVWDLDAFAGRLARGVQVEGETILVRTHLQQLGLVALLGLLLSGAALMVQIRLSLGLAFILSLLALWGLSQLLRGVDRYENAV